LLDKDLELAMIGKMLLIRHLEKARGDAYFYLFLTASTKLSQLRRICFAMRSK